MSLISLLTWMLFILTCCMPTQACKHKQLSTSSKKFGDLVYNILSKDEDNVNVAFSSISVHVLLAALYYGSSGTTRSTLKNVLDLPEAIVTAEGYRILIEFTKVRQNVSMTMANRIYVSNTLKLVTAFKTDALLYFDSGTETINFKDPSALDEINKWVTQTTKYEFQYQILPDELHTSSACIVLVNALYFNGDWLYKFTLNLGKQVFYRTPTDTIKLQTMSAKGSFEYYSNYDPDNKESFSYVRLPYKDDSLSLVLVLPSSATGLPDLEKKIASDKTFFDFKKELRDVVVTMPRFMITHKISFKSILNQIGLESVLNHSDIPKITSNGKDLHIDDVIQNIMIKVDQYGSEVAAVSMEGDASTKSSQLIYFTADRPFLFFLEINAGVQPYVLLQGRVYDPTYI